MRLDQRSDRRRTAARCLSALAIGALWSCAGCDELPPDETPRPIEVLTQIGEVGLSPGQFSYPRCIDTDGRDLWVIDKAARVQRLDPKTGAYLGGWKMPEYQLGKPTGITVGKGDGGETLLYVPDTHYHRVMIYRPGTSSELAGAAGEAQIVTQFGEYGTGPGQFIYCTDVAVLLDETNTRPIRLYVPEYGDNDRVSVFEHGPTPNSWVYSFSFGRFGSSAAAETVEFNRPQSIQIDEKNRELVITDACNHRVGRFTLDGKLIAWFGSPDEPTAAPGRFRYPYGLSLLGDGTALVAEFGGNRVQRIDLRDGRCLGLWGRPGRSKGEVAAPWGITVLGDRVYVLDSGNNRVVAFKRPELMKRGGA